MEHAVAVAIAGSSPIAPISEPTSQPRYPPQSKTSSESLEMNKDLDSSAITMADLFPVKVHGSISAQEKDGHQEETKDNERRNRPSDNISDNISPKMSKKRIRLTDEEKTERENIRRRKQEDSDRKVFLGCPVKHRYVMPEFTNDFAAET